MIRKNEYAKDGGHRAVKNIRIHSRAIQAKLVHEGALDKGVLLQTWHVEFAANASLADVVRITFKDEYVIDIEIEP